MRIIDGDHVALSTVLNTLTTYVKACAVMSDMRGWVVGRSTARLRRDSRHMGTTVVFSSRPLSR